MRTLNSHLQHLIAYDKWANQQFVALAHQMENDAPAAYSFVSHILSSQTAWLMRISASIIPEPNIWTPLPKEELQGRLDKNARGLDNLAEFKLALTARYQNTKGKEFSTPVVDILQHVITHGAYHRGQAAKALKAAGIAPPATDYIAYVRVMPFEDVAILE